MQDVKITKAIINEREEMVVNMLIKKWDFEKKEWKLLSNCKINWDTIDLQVTWLTPWSEDEEIKQKRKDLYFEMKAYANYMQESIELIEQQLYEKYNIESRKELTASQIDEEITSYRNEYLQVTQ